MMQTESKTFKITQAGRIYMRFLAAFNTGDPDMIEDFILENYSSDLMAQHPVEQLVAWHEETYNATGGMTIHKVYLTQQYYIIVIVQSKSDGALYMDKMKITEDGTNKITEYFHETTSIR